MPQSLRRYEDALRARYTYDAENGVIRFLRSYPPHVREGDVAGHWKGQEYQVSCSGTELSARRVAWWFIYGVWSDHKVVCRDDNSENLRKDNLVSFGEWMAEKRRRTCEVCGNVYSVAAGTKASKFCSRECYHAHQRTLPEPIEFRCRECDTIKPVSAFALTPSGQRRRVCDSCVPGLNRRRTLAQYGLSPAEFGRMLARQNHVCAICGEAPNNSPPVVDHNHQTGEVRGLLCGLCNTGLGHFRDNPTLLQRAAAYLQIPLALRHDTA